MLFAFCGRYTEKKTEREEWYRLTSKERKNNEIVALDLIHMENPNF